MNAVSNAFQGVGDFFSPSRTIFGCNASSETGEAVRLLGGGKTLIITSPVIRGKGLLEGIEESFVSHGLKFDVYDRDDREPTVAMVDECAALVRRRGYGLLVGVGGGSIIDLTKMVSVMAVNDGKILDYEGLDRVPKKGLPKVFVPTTAGAGAEMTRMAGATDESIGVKRDISSTWNLADVVILDPLLTVSLPAKLTAEIGVDGLAHAIEAYTAVETTPFAELTALEAIRLIGENLPQAYTRGENVEARTNMQLASALSGLALGAGKLGAVHGLAFALEAVSNLPHARCVSIMLPYAMEANIIGNPRKFALIAEAMGENGEGFTLRDAAAGSVTAVKRLLADLDISVRLSDHGVSRQKLPDLVESALGLSKWFEPNPRRLTGEDIGAIFEKALAEPADSFDGYRSLR